MPGEETSTCTLSAKKVHENEDKGHVQTPNVPVSSATPKIMKAAPTSTCQELTKKELLELAKTDMTAQSVNIKYNEMNKFLLAEIRRAESKWQGARALKRCENTNEEHAKVNMTIADEIVDNPLLSKWYGTFTVGQHGVFSINRTKAKMLLGRKLAQLRKPSAYKRKVQANSSTLNSGDTSSVTKKAKAIVVRDNEKDVPEVQKAVESTHEGEINEEPVSEQEAREFPLSAYEQQRQKRDEENKLELLKQKLVSPTFASIIALFYLQAKKLKDISVVKVKKELMKLGVTIPKSQTYSKEALVILLGKELFSKEKVVRKDVMKVISKDNLVIVE